MGELAVHADGVVALHGVAELGVEAVDVGVDIVLEELAEGRPERGIGGGIAEDEIEYLGGDSRVNPLDDREIVLCPARITRTRDGVRGDVVKKIAAPEMNFEEMTPMIIIVGGKI